jgi:hypothetical protein
VADGGPAADAARIWPSESIGGWYLQNH